MDLNCSTNESFFQHEKRGIIMKKKWYLSTIVIALMFALWIFLIPPIIGIVLLILRFRQNKANEEIFLATEKKLQEMDARNKSLGFYRYEDITQKVEEIQRTVDELTLQKEAKKQEIINEAQQEKECIISEALSEKSKIQSNIDALNNELANLNSIISENTSKMAELNASIFDLEEKEKKHSVQIANQQQKLRRIKELYKSVDYCINNFFKYIPQSEHLLMAESDLKEVEELAPTIIAQLHCMNVPDLKKAFRENEKQINTLFDQYSGRYTTKANIAIYSLMVIALRSELQNVLLNLKYEKLDTAIGEIREICAKYLSIAGNGNQSIVGTLTKFIGEIEYLFINAVKIEYNYYVKKEQARQEQLALREQMRQEAEERRALEAEKKKVEKEELKYNTQIEALKEQLSNANAEELGKLNSRILELQAQLATVIVKKKEITSLANGKAGNVYIISNLGSFGENVFKIGMTRRLDPQDRVNELGSASVPFKFDVHSFIFSDDAVSLENKLHTLLNDKRVNKVNLRKEFFRTSVDELEKLVYEIDPTAEFNKTMLAEEFRQSESGEVTLSSYATPYDDLDE